MYYDKLRALQTLVKEIGGLQEGFRSDLYVLTDTGDVNKSAMRRCRKRTTELVRMYRDFRRNSIELEKTPKD